MTLEAIWSMEKTLKWLRSVFSVELCCQADCDRYGLRLPNIFGDDLVFNSQEIILQNQYQRFRQIFRRSNRKFRIIVNLDQLFLCLITFFSTTMPLYDIFYFLSREQMHIYSDFIPNECLKEK